VQVEDLSRFSRFAMDKLMQHPAVIDMRSSFTLQRIKEITEIPV
jgi:Lrp/AsnC family leucine-responsive transcriptional regulator